MTPDGCHCSRGLPGHSAETSLRRVMKLGACEVVMPLDAGGMCRRRAVYNVRENMALREGMKLGVYEIISPLGAGGMGEVYRARDTKLNREVALKVLPEAFAGDPQRLARFKREAQLLASLNHPNIAAIYGLEESGSIPALVMELVEGPTLAERISHPVAPGFSPAGADLKVGATALALDEALPIARQMAEALEYAHEHGVIHRDLKPANVKIAPEGAVKVLDFGLAKALDPPLTSTPSPSGRGWPEGPGEGQDSPTLSDAATQAGMILGTAAYMSPEQARGKAVDRRADIWAFGCVLYEMLSGKRAFGGETLSDTLAAVLKSEPDWAALPAATPASMQRLVRRCLVKDPRQRLRDIGDARIAIEETVSGVDSVAADSRAGPAPADLKVSATARRILPWLIAAGLILIAGIAAGWWARGRRIPPSPNWTAQMLGGPSVAIGPRISPDGHTLAFQAKVHGLTQVAVMDTDSGDWTVLTKDRSRGYIGDLSWSPDGSEIYFDRYFSAPNGIYAVSRLGGDVRLVLDDAMAPQPLPDGSLIVIRVNKDRNYQLYRSWPNSGRLEALDALISGFAEFSPVRAFRDGKGIVFLGRTLEQPKADASDHLYAISLVSGNARPLGPKLNFSVNSVGFPIAVSSNDRSVLAETEAGDLYRIVSVPRYGTGPVRTLLSLTLASSFMDVDQAGNLYLDQQDRPVEALGFAASGGTPQVLVSPRNASSYYYVSFQLRGGRVVFDSLAAGRLRLVAAVPGGEAVPVIQTKEETSSPACPVGEREIAFLLGAPGHRVVAVASIADGRIVRRLSDVPGNEVKDLAASPDGKTLYYVASGTVWAIGTSGGHSRRVCLGDAVAADPNGKELIVQLNEKEGVHLMRVPVAGGAEEPILIQSALRLTPTRLSPDAVARDGRVVLSINAPDSWFWEAAILDPRSGRLNRVPLDITGDVTAPGWLGDGRILSSAWPFQSTLWRFHPAASKKE